MAEPILLDRYRDNSYNQNQIINDKLDFLIGEMRDMKQDIRALDKKIDDTRKELKGDIYNLDKKIEDVRKELKDEITDVRKEFKAEVADARKEFKSEIHTARWQVVGIVVAQICSISAVIWAVVSAVGK